MIALLIVLGLFILIGALSYGARDLDTPAMTFGQAVLVGLVIGLFRGGASVKR